MTTETATDSEGRPLAGTDTAVRSENPLFTASHPTARFRRAIQRRVQIELMPFAQGVRDALFERDDRIAKLEREVEELKKQLDTQRALALVQARLARLETDAIAIGARPANGSAHVHDG